MGHHFKILWSNLLHNSIKFTPEGGKVCVEVHRRDRCIECRITDTGIGIPLEAQTRIFERFYKVDASRERAREGSGLGLAIVRKIVELHQGTIGVVSQPHAGTSMLVSLPITEYVQQNKFARKSHPLTLIQSERGFF
nr:ATP-binding protein [Ktedonobacter racemifer]